MARSSETFGKKEKEKKKIQKRKDKEAKKLARKEAEKGSSLDAMMAYVDENGVITDTPPDPTKKKKIIKASHIVLGVPKKEAMPEEDPIHEGKVSFFNDEKGYGFIKDKSSQDSYFVHINNANGPLAEGDKVSFELEQGQKGLAAVKVKKIDAFTVVKPDPETEEDDDDEEEEGEEGTTEEGKVEDKKVEEKKEGKEGKEEKKEDEKSKPSEEEE